MISLLISGSVSWLFISWSIQEIPLSSLKIYNQPALVADCA